MANEKRISAFLLLACTLLAGSASGLSWQYDFEPGGDISQFTVVNPTAIPTYSLHGDLEIVLPSRTGGVYGGFDLADFVNRDAVRFRHTGGSDPFTLETAMRASTANTFLAGLYLYSSGGGTHDDLLFGATNAALKIDRASAFQTGVPLWNPIGPYDRLFLQVVFDGTSAYQFNYRKSQTDPWSNYWEASGYTFDEVGIFVKTWYNTSFGSSPAVDVEFDYLYYNHQIPEPATMLALGLGGLAMLRRRS